MQNGKRRVFMRCDDINYINMQAVYKPQNVDSVGDITNSTNKTKSTPKHSA